MTAPQIRPIETSYHGCRFRSRTEARRAVFFDALGVAWEYEREGYALPSGRYLPDFWLPELTGYEASDSGGVWFEVKGQYPTDREKSLARELAESQFGTAYLFWGIPRPAYEGGNGSLKFWWHETDGSVGMASDECLWYECPKCRRVGISYYWRPRCQHEFDYYYQGAKLSAAYEAARSARFGQ